MDNLWWNFSISQDPGAKFPSNKICNQKYNLITFVPKVTLNQFDNLLWYFHVWSLHC